VGGGHTTFPEKAQIMTTKNVRKEDVRDMESLQQVVLAQVHLVEAILSLLEDKGLLTMEEVTRRVEELKNRPKS
jgi:transketolase N-terminal domain/subunit